MSLTANGPYGGLRARRRSAVLRAILLASLGRLYPTLLALLGRPYPTLLAWLWVGQTDTQTNIALHIKDYEALLVNI